MGDGTTYTDFEPSHSYSAPGTYTISLYAENGCGDTNPITKQICIEPPLNPTFTANNSEGCAPFNTVLTNTTNLTDQCDNPTYNWIINYTPNFCGTSSQVNFINGTNSSSENPEIEFINPGTYQLILQTTNSCGTVSSMPQEILVKAPPQVSINNIADFCETSPTISPIASVDNCSPNNATYNWSINIGSSPTDWEFINGTTANSKFPEITFYTANSYILKLEVNNNCGTSSAEEEFIISPVPSITNTVFEQIICSGTSINEIVFNSSDPNTNYQWSGLSPTGNITGIIPSGITNNIPSHLLTLNNGTTGTVIYTVTPFLVAGCLGDPFQFTITVNEGPSVATQPIGATYCINATANLLTFSLGGSATGTINYQWYYNSSGGNDPTDANTTAVASPQGQQADFLPPTNAIGTLYYFCVISFSGSGSCGEISTIPTAIIINPNITISNETPLNQIICKGANADQLSFSTNNGGAGSITYNWFLSNDNVIDNTDTAVGTNDNTYDPGVLNTTGLYYYYVTIDVDQNLGCSDVSSAFFIVEVVEDPQVTITPNNQTICTNVSAELLVAQASGGIDINNDGSIDNNDYEFQWFLNGSSVTMVSNVSTFNHDSASPAVGHTMDFYVVSVILHRLLFK